jgi:uncharacterized protein (TIGR03437 family)
VAGQPAQAEDSIAIRATGLGAPGSFTSLMVKVGDLVVQPVSVEPISAFAGLYEIVVVVPAGAPEGEAVPLMLLVTTADGKVLESNAVTIAIEAPRN